MEGETHCVRPRHVHPYPPRVVQPKLEQIPTPLLPSIPILTRRIHNRSLRSLNLNIKRVRSQFLPDPLRKRFVAVSVGGVGGTFHGGAEGGVEAGDGKVEGVAVREGVGEGEGEVVGRGGERD
jgi:hypothetical protein